MIRMNGEKQYYSTNGIKYIDILFQKRYNLYIEVITMHIKDVKDISDVAKDIKDLTEQKKNPTREGMEKVIKSVREHLTLETEVYEDTLCVANNSPKVNIESIDSNVLYDRLNAYKTICLVYLLNKYGKEAFDEIIREYNLEV